MIFACPSGKRPRSNSSRTPWSAELAQNNVKQNAKTQVCQWEAQLEPDSVDDDVGSSFRSTQRCSMRFREGLSEPLGHARGREDTTAQESMARLLAMFGGAQVRKELCSSDRTLEASHGSLRESLRRSTKMTLRNLGFLSLPEPEASRCNRELAASLRNRSTLLSVRDETQEKGEPSLRMHPRNKLGGRARKGHPSIIRLAERLVRLAGTRTVVLPSKETCARKAGPLALSKHIYLSSGV